MPRRYRHRADQARDQHLLSDRHAAVGVRPRQRTGVRRRGATAFRRHQHADGRLSRHRRARGRRNRHAGGRRGVAVEQGFARDLRATRAPAGRRRARGLRRRVPRPARRDGDRGLRRRRRRDRQAPARASRPTCRSRSRSTITPTCPPIWSTTPTVITGYKTYPHVDMYEVGKLAGDILVARARRRDRARDGVGLAAATRVDHAPRARRTGRRATSCAMRARWKRAATCSPPPSSRRSRTPTRPTPACRPSSSATPSAAARQPRRKCAIAC